MNILQDEAPEKVSDAINDAKKVCENLGIEHHVIDLRDEFKEKVAKIAELAVGDACTGSNPRAIDLANMEKLLTCTYYGTEVDF